MSNLIDKSALIAKIKKRRDRNQEICTAEGSGAYYEDGFILDIINSLEVKEVDLEHEIEKVKQMQRNFEIKNDTIIEFCAKHFFELGLFSNLTWQDIRLIAEIGNDFMNSEESDNIELTGEAYYGAILDKVREKGRDAKTSWSENRKAKGE